MNDMRKAAMLRLADFVIRRRWYVIASVVLVTLLLAWQAMNVGLNADFSTYLRQDDPLVKEYNRIGDVFGGSSVGIVLVSGKDIFTKENLELVRKLTAAYQDVEGIAYVTSLVNVTDFRKTDFGFEVGKLLDRGKIPRTPEEMQALRTYVMQNDRYEGNLVSDDGATTAIVLRFAGGGKDAISRFAISLRIKEVTDAVAPPDALPADTRVYYGGMPFLIFNMTLLITNNLYVLVPLMVFVLVLILFIGFRHWAGIVFPLLVVLISDIWLVGLMGVFGYNFDLLTGIIPVLLLALGSADGIHLLKRYFERRRTGENAREASRLVFQDMGKPIVLTTITTMVGFASLVVSDFSVIKQFGLLAALGVLLALVITLTLLPALLSFGVTMKSPRIRAAKPSRFLLGFSTFVYRQKSAILIGAAVSVVIFVFAIPRIQKDVDWSLCLQKDSAPYHAEMLLRKKFGGSLPVQILVSGDIKDPATLKQMRVIERRLDAVPLVSRSQSIAGIIAEMDDVMNDRYIVPESRRGVSNLWFLIEGEDMMEQMVENEDREGLLQAKLSTWHTGSLVAAVDSINAFLAALPSKIAVVDLNKISPEKRDDVLSIKKQQMLNNLRLDLRRYGVSMDNDDLRTVVNRALVVAIDSASRRKVYDAVASYLRGSEAEVELPAAVVRRIGLAVSRDVDAGQSFDSENVASIIERNAPGLRTDDARFLAESLVEVARQAFGESRITPALALLEEKLPGKAGRNANLRRDIKGTLWQANENLLFVDAAAAKDVLTEGDNALERELDVRVKQTGLAPVLKRMEEELTPTQVETLLTSLLFVIILLSIIHRSFVGGVLSVIPITITILLNFAVMGYFGIGLDSFTAMIASVAIGLGIDTDIHFVSRFRKELRVDGNEFEALRRTIGTTGVSITVNALAVGVGFLVLLAAGGQHIRRFGGLTALTIMASAVFTLTVLPALFLWLQPKFLKEARLRGLEASTAAAVAAQRSTE